MADIITFPINNVLRETVEKELNVGQFITVDWQPTMPSNLCYRNVDARVAALGGRGVLGWQIEWWPKLFARALYHAVHETNTGALMDVTKGEEGDVSDHITFATDKIVAGKLQGNVPAMVPNKFCILVDEPEVREVIAALDHDVAFKRRQKDDAIARGFRDVGPGLAPPSQLAMEAFRLAHQDEERRTKSRVERAFVLCRRLAARLS